MLQKTLKLLLQWHLSCLQESGPTPWLFGGVFGYNTKRVDAYRAGVDGVCASLWIVSQITDRKYIDCAVVIIAHNFMRERYHLIRMTFLPPKLNDLQAHRLCNPYLAAISHPTLDLS